MYVDQRTRMLYLEEGEELKVLNPLMGAHIEPLSRLRWALVGAAIVVVLYGISALITVL